MGSSKANSTSFKPVERFEYSCPECKSTFLKRAKEFIEATPKKRFAKLKEKVNGKK